jgi:hypothetical protein
VTDWQQRVRSDGRGGLEWLVPPASWDEHWEPLPQGNVNLLSRGADGKLVRQTGSVDASGTQLQLKGPGAPVPFAPAQLYGPLLK